VNLRGIRTDLAGACSGREFTPYDVLPASSPELPAAVVGWPDIIQFNATHAGGARLTLGITLYFSRADDEAAQERLDDVLSGGLINDIARRTSPHWVAIDVPRLQNIETRAAGGAELLTAELVVELITTP